MQNLKNRAIRSGVAKVLNQGATTLLRVGFLVVLARLLTPYEFGLVGMVTVVTGALALFTSAGLSSATVQKQEISDRQTSTLFWVNILVGMILTLLCAASASSIASFYDEPRLFWIAVALAPAFILNAAGVQHSALLQRELRYATLSVIDTCAQLGSVLVGIVLAFRGYGYWALVVAALVQPAINTAGCWLTTGWVPGRPGRDATTRSMLRFGGTITLNSLVVYIGYNGDKLLLGRFWGADMLGLYARAFQIVNLPVTAMNSAVGDVLFSAISRLQGDPARVRSFYLAGYSMVMAVTIPITLFSALFAEDIIVTVLGTKWVGAVVIFRLLTPTILIFGIINPIYWLLLGLGKQTRSLQIALVITPIVMISYCVGIAYGPTGVALSYSVALTLWLYPHLAWCLHGTPISVRDLARTIADPFLASLIAVAVTVVMHQLLFDDISPLIRLPLGAAVMAAIYGTILLFVMKHRKAYLDILRSIRQPTVPGVAVQ